MKNYRCEGTYKGKYVIIDISDLEKVGIGHGYEVIVMTKRGYDLECKTFSDLSDAAACFWKFKDKYLSERYAHVSEVYPDAMQKALINIFSSHDFKYISDSMERYYRKRMNELSKNHSDYRIDSRFVHLIPKTYRQFIY